MKCEETNFRVTLSNISMQLSIWYRVQLDRLTVVLLPTQNDYCCGTKWKKTWVVPKNVKNHIISNGQHFPEKWS